MIDLQLVVMVIVYLIVAAIIFGLLYWLIGFIAQKVPGVQPFVWIAYVVLAVAAVLICIGLLLSFVGGKPMFRWGPVP